MPTDPKVRRIVREILKDWPGSIRSLARASGVDASTLVKIREGKVGLSPDAARRIAGALRRMSVRCAELAGELEAATTTHKGDATDANDDD